MNKKMLRVLCTALVLGTTLVGCSSSPEDELIANKGAEALYEDAKQQFPKGVTEIKPYLRMTPQPNK